MPRPRKFDEAELLRCAMLRFWQSGFDATTFRALETETGVGVRSLHNTFGEKEELFVKALDAYDAMASGILDEVFRVPGVDAIVTLFSGMSAPRPADDPAQSGCLMVNSVFELPEPSEPIAQRIAAYRAMWITHFRTALEADGISDAQARAEFLLGALWGILSQIRLAGDTTAAKPMADVIVQTVAGWRSARP